MEAYPLAPVVLTDFIGSALMIVLSCACVRYAFLLRRARPANVLWTYLLAFSLALAAFSVSRGVGHLVGQLLSFAGKGDVWKALLPYSGAVNTLMFVVVGSITLFFQRVQIINREILNDKRDLEKASSEVIRLNRDLQSLVEARTRQLSASEVRYRALFEGSIDVVFIVDDTGRFEDLNQAGVRTLGYESPEELIGVLSLKDVFVKERDYDALAYQLRTHGFVRDRECLLMSRNGDEILVLLGMSAKAPDAHVKGGYHGIAKDITARKRMERQLQRADRLASLGQISAGIAHEINNPLGIILGYAQLIMRGCDKGTQGYEDVRTIERQAQNCRRIVGDLLKFARAADTRKTVVNVNQCLRDLLALLARQFESAGIMVEARLDPELPAVVGDTDKIKQVFMNLLVNAKQAITGSGRIGIETAHDVESGQICVIISDTGVGIPEDLADKVFDPFFTTKPVGEGTGLGLSVSYGIIHDHGGTIELNSEVGKGTVFTIQLPARVDESAKNG
ncbi:MAG: ATP-binding protein [Desulfomonilaceae bacterium]|nr:ATP-binding protein [Desulfomonilaceae bacterium]